MINSPVGSSQSTVYSQFLMIFLYTIDYFSTANKAVCRMLYALGIVNRSFSFIPSDLLTHSRCKAAYSQIHPSIDYRLLRTAD